jgi:hypothetical protein
VLAGLEAESPNSTRPPADWAAARTRNRRPGILHRGPGVDAGGPRHRDRR